MRTTIVSIITIIGFAFIYFGLGEQTSTLHAGEKKVVSGSEKNVSSSKGRIYRRSRLDDGGITTKHSRVCEGKRKKVKNKKIGSKKIKSKKSKRKSSPKPRRKGSIYLG